MANKGYIFQQHAVVWSLDCTNEVLLEEVLVCGGAPVKSLRCCLILILLGLSSSAALANGVTDPGVQLGGTGSTGTFTQSQCTPSGDFSNICSLAVDSAGNAIADITNDLGATIVSDTVTILSAFVGNPTGDNITCTIDPAHTFGFNSATNTPNANSCTFTEVPVLLSILDRQQYGLHDMGFCPTGGCSTDPTHPTFLSFNLSAKTVPSPEPSSILLLGTGLVALMKGRKRVKGLSQNA
jgi:hypothetical protein